MKPTSEFIVRLEGAVPRIPEYRFTAPVNFTIREDENWAIIGQNGAGKTLLSDMLQGQIYLKEGSVELAGTQLPLSQQITSVSFRDIYSLTDCRQMYYQQRWNASDVALTPVAETLLEVFDPDKIREYTALFGIGHLLRKRIISLSSGELRKFLIIRALLKEPRLLILDNPFIGLDAASRELMHRMLSAMTSLQNLQTVVLLSDPNDIPSSTHRILPVKNKTLYPELDAFTYFQNPEKLDFLFDPVREIQLPADDKSVPTYDHAVRLRNVSIRYNGQILLEAVNLEIKAGEKWALLGANGSGKSTLLSLLCGDNPQAYANDIVLFDRPRGTGESIWDIKKRIGYLSADVHTFYQKDIPAWQVTASGLYDSIGLYDDYHDRDKERSLEWLQLFGSEHLAEKSFVKLSYGEQRLVLLARTFVKMPELLILDEPLHGLDAGKKRLAGRIIEAYCEKPGRTLIFVTHYREEIPACVNRTKLLIESEEKED